jgi:hypothetical protein
MPGSGFFRIVPDAPALPDRSYAASIAIGIGIETDLDADSDSDADPESTNSGVILARERAAKVFAKPCFSLSRPDADTPRRVFASIYCHNHRNMCREA